MSVMKFCFVFAMLFVSFNVDALTLRVPSLGAQVVDADAILVGVVSGAGTNAVFKVEENICAEKEIGSSIGIVSFGITPFISFSEVAGSLRNRRCIVLARKTKGGISLPHGVWSTLPRSGDGDQTHGDIRTWKMVIGCLLKYKALMTNQDEGLVATMLNDIVTSSGRMAVTAFLADDVNMWRGKDALRRDVGCVIGTQLQRMNIFDDASVRFFCTGMRSLPSSIRIPFLYEASMGEGECSLLSRETLMTLLGASKERYEDVSREMIDSYMRRSANFDMRKVLHLLRSNQSEFRECATIILSRASRRECPKFKTVDEQVQYWNGIMEEMKRASRVDSHR